MLGLGFSGANKGVLGRRAQPALCRDSGNQQVDPAPIDWGKQWWPVAAVRDLDPRRPHSFVLAEKKLVVWRDGQGQWRCFEDICPHRKVPLSEGRIENEDGTLMCGYHGWRFDGTGQCTRIPQIHATSKKQEQAALRTPKACAKSYPTQVTQDLLFVWSSSSPEALEDSAKVLPTLSSLKMREGEFQYDYEQFHRCLNGGFEFWVENSMDQSHTSFAHHSKGGHSRGGPHEGSFQLKSSSYSPQKIEFDYTFSLTGHGLVDAKTVFKPPNLLELSIKQLPDMGLWIYCVPVTRSSTRLIISSGKILSQRGSVKQLLSQPSKIPSKLLFKFLSTFPLGRDLNRALKHLHLHDVTDGDAVFMHQQSANVNELGDSVKRWNNAYFLPGENDRGVSLWMKWLMKVAGGGPVWDSEPISGKSVEDSLGKLNRRELLDRFTQHTEGCSSCKRALEATERAVEGASVLLGLAILALAAALGQGCHLVSLPVAASGLTTALTLVAFMKLRAFKERFYYQEYHQSYLPDVKK